MLWACMNKYLLRRKGRLRTTQEENFGMPEPLRRIFLKSQNFLYNLFPDHPI